MLKTVAIKKSGPVAQDGKSKPSGFGMFNIAPVQGPPARGLLVPHPHARPAAKVRFTLNTALAKTDDVADAEIVTAHCGQLTQTFGIQNLPVLSNYGFEGKAGEYGSAQFDFIQKRYIITSTERSCRCCDDMPFSDDFNPMASGYVLQNMGASSGTLLYSATGEAGFAYRCANMPISWSTITGELALVTFAPMGVGSGVLEMGLKLVTDGAWSGGDEISLISIHHIVGFQTDPLEYEWTAGSASGTISEVPAEGDVLKVELIENGGSYDAKFYVNGTLKHTETSIDNTVDVSVVKRKSLLHKILFGAHGTCTGSTTATMDDLSLSYA